MGVDVERVHGRAAVLLLLLLLLLLLVVVVAAVVLVLADGVVCVCVIGVSLLLSSDTMDAAGTVDSGRALKVELVATDVESAASLHASAAATAGGGGEDWEWEWEFE
jgi:hypothetical protein